MRIRMLRRSATHVILSLFVGLTTPLLAADPSFPPAMSIGLEPPAGMTPSTSFSGFEHRSGASIVIVEMPVEAYAQVVAGFTAERLRPTGFVANGESQDLAVAGSEGRVLRGSQKANGVTYAKWIAILKGQSGTGLVTVQVPETAATEVPATAVEAALRTIAFRAPGSINDQIAALPYTVGDMAGFRPVRVLAGSGLLMTKGPKDIDPDGTQPIVIIASSIGQSIVAKEQQTAFAKRAFGSLAGLKDITITDESQPAGGAQPVVRLRGSGKHSKSDQAMSVTQTVLFKQDGYLRVIGMAPAAAGDIMSDADRIAASTVFR